MMESQDIEQALRDELRRAGERWGKFYREMTDAKKVEYLGKLLARRFVAEIAAKRHATKREEAIEPRQVDSEIIGTSGPLEAANGTGGGRRNVRSTKPMS